MFCLKCDKPLVGEQVKFCSRSCATSVNNVGLARNKTPKAACATCSNPVTFNRRKFCSRNCSNVAKRVGTEEERQQRRRRTRLAITRRYQARKYGQVLTPEVAAQIRKIYADCPEGYEVDHRIPLSKGGLHHPSNLQYLTMPDNRRKSNKL